jgi:tRNA-binding EMAP/Myf-like protein
MPWQCPECEFDNEDADVVCQACDAQKPVMKESESSDPFHNIVVAEVAECEDMEGTKLKKLLLQAGGPQTVQVVTTAPNVKKGVRAVVALPGAVVAGVEVKKTQISGIPSNGMICNSAALGWSGGGANTAALVPLSFPIGSKPPHSRPRMES